MPTIQIQAADGGAFSAYLATPKSGKGPGVVVIQEIFGINAGIRAIADHLAAQGFAALAPDLFWRLEPGVEITDKSKAEWDKAFDLMNRFDQAKGIEDIKSTIAVLRKNPASPARSAASVTASAGGWLT